MKIISESGGKPQSVLLHDTKPEQNLMESKHQCTAFADHDQLQWLVDKTLVNNGSNDGTTADAPRCTNLPHAIEGVPFLVVTQPTFQFNWPLYVPLPFKALKDFLLWPSVDLHPVTLELRDSMKFPSIIADHHIKTDRLVWPYHGNLDFVRRQARRIVTIRSLHSTVDLH